MAEQTGEKKTGLAATVVDRIFAFRKKFAAFRSSDKVRKYTDFFYSPIFIYVMAIIMVPLYVLGIDEISFCFLLTVGGVTLIFCPDILPSLVPAVMGALTKSINNRQLQKFTAASYAVIAVFGVLAAACFVFHLIVNFKADGLRAGKLWLGYLLLAAGLFTNGFFYSDYVYLNLVSGLSHIAVFVGIYVVVRALMRPTRDSLRYFSYICMVCGLMASIHLCLAYFMNKPFIDSGFSDKALLHVGWGMSNSVGTMLFRCMPLCFYLMCTESKHNWYYFLAAVLMVIATVFTYARSSLIITVPVFGICYILVLIFGKNRRQSLVCGGVCLVLGIAGVVVLWDKLSTLLKFFIENGFSDRGRFGLWDEAVGLWRKYPVFGVGLRRGYKTRFMTYYYFHNTVMQFLAAGGTVGVATYLFHRMQTVALFTQRPTLDRTFLLLLLAGIWVMSLLGCQYMYYSAHIFVAPALVLAEHDLSRTLPFAYGKKGKPGKYKRLFGVM